MEMTKPARNQKISYRDILTNTIGYSAFVDLYQQRVLAKNTRTIRLLGRKSPARIIHTLLGFEVQAAYKRIQCPDMVTARYLKLFSEIGCHSIKLPYDPTLTAELIPVFESMLQSIVRCASDLFPRDVATQRKVIRNIFAILRAQLRSV
jgi:hypothetical protein